MFALPPALLTPAAGGGGADPNFAGVKLLLHCDGANDSTTFTDTSSQAFTVTANGNAQLQTADKQFGSASGLFDGTGDYLALSTASDWKFLHDGTTWTLETWIKLGATSRLHDLFGTAFNAADSGILVQITTAGRVHFFLFHGTGSPTSIILNGDVTGVAITDATTWHHLALTYEFVGGVTHTFEAFIDGVSAGTLSNTGTPANVNPHDPLQIGRYADPSSSNFLGALDDIRITSGVRRYTANFAPPAAAFPDS